jgi:hypothetical protein
MTEIEMLRYPGCVVETAQTCRNAIELPSSWGYNLAIFGLRGIRGHDLLRPAVTHKYFIPAVMFTGKALTPETFKKSIDLETHMFLPKRHLGVFFHFPEGVLTYEYDPP